MIWKDYLILSEIASYSKLARASKVPPPPPPGGIGLRLPFTLSGVFSFSYITSLIRIGKPQPIYQWKAYEII